MPQNLQEVKPHVFVSVPRVYEKVYSKVQEGVAAGSPIKQKLFAWAVGLGRTALPYRLKRRKPPGLLGLKFGRGRQALFRQDHRPPRRTGEVCRLRRCAALGDDLAAFFIGAGVEILEGYGLTETSPVIAVNRPDKRRASVP